MSQPPLLRREAVHWSILPLLIFTPIGSHAQTKFDIERAFILDSTVYEPWSIGWEPGLRRALALAGQQARLSRAWRHVLSVLSAR